MKAMFTQYSIHISYLIRLGVLGVFCIIWAQASAQQTPLYGHFYMNPYLYNPAMAGFGDVSSANFLYRKQWAGVDGAPETQVFTLDGSLENHPLGLGVMFLNDIMNILGRTGGVVTGSYEVDLTPTQSLRFGLSFMALRNRVFFDRIRAEDISDPNLLENVDNRTIFEGAAGFSYNFKKLRIGVSGEQLFQNTFRHNEQAAFKELNYTLVRHYYTTAEYLFDLGANFKLKPQILARTVQGLRTQFDGFLYTSYKDFIWTNLIYRHGIGAGASFGFKLEDQYVFGYAYEFPTTDLNIVGSSTHEITFGIKIHGKVPTGSLASTQERRVQYENTANAEKIDAIAQQNEQVKDELDRTEKQLQTQNIELERLKKVVETYQKELAQAMVQLGVTGQDSTDAGHQYYVIVGALRQFNNAKSFQKLLKREADLDTRIIQSNSKTWYFLYSHATNSVSEALSELNRVKKSDAMPFIIEIPWIYKSEND